MSIGYALCSALIAVLLSIWPQIFDTILQTNQSQLQSRAIQIVKTEYFFDKKKNLYLSLLHTSVVLCIGSITLTAAGTMHLGFIIYICGMLKIAR